MKDTLQNPAAPSSCTERIIAFDAAVRAELVDLTVDAIEDLVGGLVGDRTEQADDNGGERELDDPVSYAYELRSWRCRFSRAF